ncbi:hypothetical protein ABKV19_018021 [Rosa sericea]
MKSEGVKWVLGLIYIFAVASIWIAASFVVQSVVDAGVSPFLITYICNSLFVIYIPLVEAGRYLEDSFGGFWFWKSKESSPLRELVESEQSTLLGDGDAVAKTDDASVHVEEGEIGGHGKVIDGEVKVVAYEPIRISANLSEIDEVADKQVDEKGRWTRTRVAKVSLLISPFWFFAQLTFNLSLKYTTVTSNTILSSASSLFTFLVSLAFLVALVLHFSKLEPFYMLTWKQLGLIVGKGLLDNVLSDYLWAKAVLLTTTTVATAGLSIQVPLAAIVDTVTGHAPHFADYFGAVAVMIGFVGINIPSDAFKRSKGATLELENGNNRNSSSISEPGGSPGPDSTVHS